MKGKPSSRLKQLQSSIKKVANQMAIDKEKMISDIEEANTTIIKNFIGSKSEICMINDQLTANQVTSLNLSNTQLSIDDLMLLTVGITKCPSLTHVDLSHNQNLTNSNFKDGSSALGCDLINFNEIFMSCSLESFTISADSYTDLMAALKSFISSKKTLKYVDISYSDLTAKDIQCISSNQHLKKLVIENVTITDYIPPAYIPGYDQPAEKYIPSASLAHETIIQSLMSNPNLVIKVDSKLGNEEVVRNIAEASFLQLVTRSLDTLPEDVSCIILDYAEDAGNHLELAGSLFVNADDA